MGKGRTLSLLIHCKSVVPQIYLQMHTLSWSVYTQRGHNLDFLVATQAILISPRWGFSVVT